MKGFSTLSALLICAGLVGNVTETRASETGMAGITGTVFVIVMENQNWSNIKGSSNAPYINSLLTNSQASYAKAYFNPPGNHPSEPNYIWIEAGTNFGIRNDNDPNNT